MFFIFFILKVFGFFVLSVIFIGGFVVVFFFVWKSKEKFEEYKIWKDILKRILYVLVFVFMIGFLSSIYIVDVVKG